MSGGRAGERAHCRQAAKLLRLWACTKARASGHDRKRPDGLTAVSAPLWARASRRVRVRAAAMPPMVLSPKGMTRSIADHAVREDRSGWAGLREAGDERAVGAAVGRVMRHEQPAGRVGRQ